MSDRRFRFQTWQRFLESGGALLDLGHMAPPPGMSRMASVMQGLPSGSLIADTGAAAVWGGLVDPRVAAMADDGFSLLNIGNQHTLAVVVRGDRILAVLEHHTCFMTAEKIRHLLDSFHSRNLTDESVYADKGHGCAYSREALPVAAGSSVVITGPKRGIATGLGFYEAAPAGNMMLAGAYGLAALYDSIRQR